MGLLDKLIGNSDFLSGIQGFMNPNGAMQRQQPPQQPPVNTASPLVPPPAPVPEQKSGGGSMDLIMKIMQMFGG